MSEYEFARKVLKQERERPSAFSNNRKQAALERVQKKYGDKGLKEFAREHKKDLGLK